MKGGGESKSKTYGKGNSRESEVTGIPRKGEGTTGKRRSVPYNIKAVPALVAAAPAVMFIVGSHKSGVCAFP